MPVQSTLHTVFRSWHVDILVGFDKVEHLPLSFSSFEVLKEIHLLSSYHKNKKVLQVIRWLPAMCFLANLMLYGQQNISHSNPCGVISAKSRDQFSLYWQFTLILFCPQSISNCINFSSPALLPSSLPKKSNFYPANVSSITQWENAQVCVCMQGRFKSPPPTLVSFISAAKSEYQPRCFFDHITCKKSVVPKNKLS